MKNQTTIAFAISILTVGDAMAAEMGGMKTEASAGMTKENPQINHATGVVKDVDSAIGTITISHEAVPSINWPAMTMTFKADKPVTSGIKAGDRVNFDFVTKGMEASVTKISQLK